MTCDVLAGVSGVTARANGYLFALPPLLRLPPYLYFHFLGSRAFSPLHLSVLIPIPVPVPALTFVFVLIPVQILLILIPVPAIVLSSNTVPVPIPIAVTVLDSVPDPVLFPSLFLPGIGSCARSFCLSTSAPAVYRNNATYGMTIFAVRQAKTAAEDRRFLSPPLDARTFRKSVSELCFTHLIASFFVRTFMSTEQEEVRSK